LVGADDGVEDEQEFAHAGDEASIRAASRAVAALSAFHPLVYVDWAWGYRCQASDENAFASLLRNKLKTIAETMKSFKSG
jgi:hypothetical protein